MHVFFVFLYFYCLSLVGSEQWPCRKKIIAQTVYAVHFTRHVSNLFGFVSFTSNIVCISFRNRKLLGFLFHFVCAALNATLCHRSECDAWSSRRQITTNALKEKELFPWNGRQDNYALCELFGKKPTKLAKVLKMSRKTTDIR